MHSSSNQTATLDQVPVGFPQEAESRQLTTRIALLVSRFFASLPDSVQITLRHWRQRLIPPTRAQQEACRAYSRVLSVFLREPSQFTRQALVKQRRFQHLLEHRRHRRLYRSTLRRHLKTFSFPQQQAYTQLLVNDPRSRLLVSFHFGDYVYGMHHLVNSVVHSGPVKVLSLSPGAPVYWENVRTAFGASAAGREAELISNEQSVASLSVFLREAHSTLLMYCDLPAGNGALTAVQFFRREAWFPRGPATLALINRIPMLPVITYQEGSQNRIELFPQLETNVRHDESCADCITRLTQSLVSILEQHVAVYPEQWRYLQCLPAYFGDDGINNRKSMGGIT